MKLRKLKDNTEAVLGYFIAFILAATMLIFLFSFAIPFLVEFTTDLYLAGDAIITDTESKIDNISNATIRSQIQSSLDDMQGSTADTIEYLGFFYQYSWIFIVIIVMFTIFILARQTVETRGYSGVV